MVVPVQANQQSQRQMQSQHSANISYDEYGDQEDRIFPFELELVEGALMVATGVSLLAQTSLCLTAPTAVAVGAAMLIHQYISFLGLSMSRSTQQTPQVCAHHLGIAGQTKNI